MKIHYNFYLVLLFISILLFLRFRNVDYDNVRNGASVLSLYYNLSILPLIHISLLAFLIVKLIKLESIRIDELVLIIHPFLWLNLGEVYNKFIVILVIVTFFPKYLSYVLLLFIHPVASLVMMALTFKMKTSHLLFIGFTLIASALNLDLLLTLIGKGAVLQNIGVLSEVNTGNLTMEFTESDYPSWLVFLGSALFPLIMGVNASTIGALILGISFLVVLREKFLFIIIIIVLYAHVNPNLGAIYRNIYPVIVALVLFRERFKKHPSSIAFAQGN